MRRLPAVSLLLLLACGPRMGSDEPAGTTADDGDDGQTFFCVEREQVDILFVIEDTPAMAGAQDRVSGVAELLLRIFTLDDETDYRVAFTTASVAGPQCAGAQDGAFVATSCRERLDDFPGALAGACTENCGLDGVPTRPTAIDGVDGAASRPWLESRNGATNLGGIDPREAAACLAPQGIAGCDYPAPLEAMTRALDRTQDPADPAYGFLRADARLIIAFVEASPECSVDPRAAAIFDPAGARVFWSDPAVATPGICWNAGVHCSGGPTPFDDCVSANHDLGGAVDVPDGEAVLYPVARYIDRLQGLVASGRTTGVQVGVVSGVDDIGIVYTEACAPAQLAATGICPGCSMPDDVQATPPVRLRTLASAFPLAGTVTLVSLCGDPSWLWVSVPSRDESIPVTCLSTCARDLDPATELLDPSCIATDTRANGASVALPPCLAVADRWEPPPGADACFAMRIDDRQLTPAAIDDLSEVCIDRGHNAEFIVVRAVPAATGVCTSIACEPSTTPQIDCPRR